MISVNYFFLLSSIMKKTFWYLLFMVIFLPTFGFTTAQASIEFLWNTNKNDTYRWECIFLPDSGAFFVNYVTTAALGSIHILRKQFYSTKINLTSKFFTKTGFFSSNQKNFFFNITFWRNFHAVVWIFLVHKEKLLKKFVKMLRLIKKVLT